MTPDLEDFPPNLQHCYHLKDGWCPDCFSAVLAAVRRIIATGYTKNENGPRV